MSLYAFIDGEDCGQVATVKGWSDFFEWADRQRYEELAHLIYHGYALNLELLADCIDTAMQDEMPSPDVADIARGIEALCREHADKDVIIVSDGDGDGTIEVDS